MPEKLEQCDHPSAKPGGLPLTPEQCLFPFPIAHSPFGLVRSHAYVGKRTERYDGADYLSISRYSLHSMEVDYERESVAWTEFVLADGGPHALRTAVGHRANPVRDRIRRLDVQPLIAPQVRAHKHGRPDRESDPGVAFGANRSNRECALQCCSVDTTIQAGLRRSCDGV